MSDETTEQPYRSVEGLRIERRRPVLRIRPRPAREAQRPRPTPCGGLIGALSAGRSRRVRARDRAAWRRRSLLRRRSTSSAATPGDVRPRVGQHPAPPADQAHRLIELLLPRRRRSSAAVQGWAAGIGLQLVLASDFAVVDRRRPSLGALRRSGASPPTVGHLVAAPPDRRGPGPRDAPVGRGRLGRRRRRAGAWCTGRAGQRARRRGARPWPSGWRRRPRWPSGLTKWLLHAGTILATRLNSCRTKPWPWSCRRAAKTFVRVWPPSWRSGPPTSADDEHARRGAGIGGRLDVGATTPVDEVLAAVRAWLEDEVPASWLAAGRRGGPAEVRTVRTRADYEAWYPVFGVSGLVAPTWPVEYGGLGCSADRGAPRSKRSCGRSTSDGSILWA